MPRARNIKPALFKNELLGEADPLLTILFCGLWCLADRDGKLEDRPKRIKAEIFPYRECHDINGYLTELAQLGFIERYEADGTAVIRVIEFAKHQSPHKTEKASELPDRPENTRVTCNAPLDNGALTDVAALIPDSLIPDSLIPDSLERGAKPKRFVPPTRDEVAEYCKERGNRVNPDQFIDHYTANGWVQGRGRAIKCWKSAVRTWERREGEFSGNGKIDSFDNPFRGAK